MDYGTTELTSRCFAANSSSGDVTVNITSVYEHHKPLIGEQRDKREICRHFSILVISLTLSIVCFALTITCLSLMLFSPDKASQEMDERTLTSNYKLCLPCIQISPKKTVNNSHSLDTLLPLLHYENGDKGNVESRICCASDSIQYAALSILVSEFLFRLNK